MTSPNAAQVAEQVVTQAIADFAGESQTHPILPKRLIVMQTQAVAAALTTTAEQSAKTARQQTAREIFGTMEQLTNDAIRLYFGELSRTEMRMARGILSWQATVIRSRYLAGQP